MAAFHALQTRRIADRWPASGAHRMTVCGTKLVSVSWRFGTL